MAIEVKLPDLGDRIDSGDVLEVLVREGEQIAVEQGIIELETDKATVEVPSPFAGKVTAVHVTAGQTVPVGGMLLTLDLIDQPVTDDPPQPKSEPTAAVEAEPVTAAPEPEPAVPAAATADSGPSQPSAAAQPMESAPESSTTDKSGTNGDAVPAGPAVRRFAREVGIDLRRVEGTGQGGRITRQDVLNAVRHASQSTQTTKESATSTESQLAAAALPGEPGNDAWGPIRTEKMPKIRRTIAARMHESWTTIPRVTNFDDADVTELEKMRQANKADYAQAGLKLTTMPFLIKAVAMALREHASINASLDMDNEQIVYKDYVNVGVAVDTPRGLIVPSLRNADRLSIPETARNLAQLAKNARDGKFSVEDLRGGTFTISNLGAIGGTYSTPIINSPEVAILLMGRSRKMPVAIDDQVKIRLMMPLSLSYDHRLVDGATAARFLNDVISFLESPSRVLLAP